MEIIKKMEYNEKKLIFEIYETNWMSTETYRSENLEEIEKFKKEIAKKIIMKHLKIKFNSQNEIKLLYAFLKTKKHIKEFLNETFNLKIKDEDEIKKFQFILCCEVEAKKEKAKNFLENVAIPKFWEYFFEENKLKATLFIFNNNIKKYIKNVKTDKEGYIKKIKWTKKITKLDFKTSYVLHKFNPRFNFVVLN